MPGGILLEFPELFFTGLWLTIQLSVLGFAGAPAARAPGPPGLPPPPPPPPPPAPADFPGHDPAARQHRHRPHQEPLARVDDRRRGAAAGRRDRGVAHVPRGGGLRRRRPALSAADAALERRRELAPAPAPDRAMSELLEALRGAVCGITGIRCDTWYLFADPNIIRFFGEGLVETRKLSVVSVGLSFPVGLLFPVGP